VRERGIVVILPYTFVFLLSLNYRYKKVLIEPDSIWVDLEDYLDKIQVFQKNYGEFFYHILIIPKNFVVYI